MGHHAPNLGFASDSAFEAVHIRRTDRLSGSSLGARLTFRANLQGRSRGHAFARNREAPGRERYFF